MAKVVQPGIRIAFFCGLGVRNATNHVLAQCMRFLELRNKFLAAVHLDAGAGVHGISLAILRARPNDCGFCEAVCLAHEMDMQCAVFWKMSHAFSVVLRVLDIRDWQRVSLPSASFNFTEENCA